MLPDRLLAFEDADDPATEDRFFLVDLLLEEHGRRRVLRKRADRLVQDRD